MLEMLGVLPLPAVVSLGGRGSLPVRLHGDLIRRQSYWSKFSLGFLTPVLPCGVLYAMLAKAAAGSASHGALTMIVFGVGMAPALMLLGSVSSFFSARVRQGADILAAATIILMGVILILRGLHVPFVGLIPTGGREHHAN